jgi:hypothetical protein
MTGFDEREKEFEARFKHDQELAFKVKTRRNRLLGLWAADHLGLSGAAKEAYAKAVVDAEFAPHGEDAVLAKLHTDFSAKGVALPEAQLRDEMERLLAEAKKQVMKE